MPVDSPPCPPLRRGPPLSACAAIGSGGSDWGLLIRLLRLGGAAPPCPPPAPAVAFSAEGVEVSVVEVCVAADEE